MSALREADADILGKPRGGSTRLDRCVRRWGPVGELDGLVSGGAYYLTDEEIASLLWGGPRARGGS